MSENIKENVTAVAPEQAEFEIIELEDTQLEEVAGGGGIFCGGGCDCPKPKI